MKLIMLLIMGMINTGLHAQIQAHRKIPIPRITANFEKLDMEKFNHSPKESDGLVKEVTHNGNTLITYLYEEEGNREYVTEEFINNSYYRIVKEYYANGNIKNKSVRVINGGLLLGMSYTFNANGRLEKSIDNSERYKFSFMQLLDLLNKKKIPFPLNKSQSRNWIMGDYEGGIPTYYVTIETKSTDGYPVVRHLKVDGRNGMIISDECNNILEDECY